MRFLLLLFAYLTLYASSPLIFKGNENLSSRELYDVLGLRFPYAIEIWEDQPTLQNSAISQSITALTSYYRSKGYFETRIQSEETNASITFVIQENLPIKVGDITINSDIPIMSAIELSSGSLFDQDKFVASKAAIKKRYSDAGFCNASFNSKAWVDLESHEAHLLFEGTPNEPCTFGAISVETTPNIDGNLTASMLRITQGDPYTLEAIQQSYEALYTQEGIARVSINDSERIGSIVPITVDIDEVEKPIRFNAGLGYSSDEGFGAQIGLKHRNFLGDLKTLSLDAKYTQIRQEASGLLSIPLKNRLIANGEVGYSDELFDGYRSESVYEKLSLKHQDIPTSILAAILFDQAKTYESTNIEAFPENNLFILSPMVELNYDTRDKMLEPTKGNWVNLKAQGSLYSPISDATYFKTTLMGSHIQSFDQHVLAGRVQWGTLRAYDGSIPSSYRFYAGGMNSNRAYSYRELGPKDSHGDPIGFTSLLEGTLEYRFPIYELFRGVLFSDLTYGSNDYIPDYDLPYLGVGAGLRYVTPIGPIAIDFGIDPTDYSQYTLHFRIGELF